MEREVLTSPLLYLSAWFEGTRDEYYGHLQAVRERAAWEPWLGYFLTGVTRQANDAISRARRINDLLAAWRQRAAAAPSATPAALVDLLADNPFWTIRGVADRLGVAFTTAARAVTRLQTDGILAPTSDARRDRVYCAREILEILEEPATLTG